MKRLNNCNTLGWTERMPTGGRRAVERSVVHRAKGNNLSQCGHQKFFRYLLTIVFGVIILWLNVSVNILLAGQQGGKGLWLLILIRLAA